MENEAYQWIGWHWESVICPMLPTTLDVATVKMYDHPRRLLQMPTEILQTILLYIPLDIAVMRSLSLTCKRFTEILSDYFLAKRHVSAFLAGNGKTPFESQNTWANLPIVYRAAALCTILQYSNMEYKTRPRHVLVSRNRSWKRIQLSESAAITCFQLCLDKDFSTIKNDVKPFILSHWILTRCCPQLLRMVIQKGRDGETSLLDPGENGQHMLLRCCRVGYTQAVKLLLQDDRVDPASCSNEALYRACAEGNQEIVSILLADPRVDPRIRPLCCSDAAASGYTSVIEELLKDPRVDPYRRDANCFTTAIRLNKLSIVKALLANERVLPSGDARWALRHAVFYGKTELLALLLESNRVKPTAELITMTTNQSILCMLLKGPRIDCNAEDGWILKWAAKNGFTQVVALLLEDWRRVDPSAGNDFALRIAGMKGHYEVVRLLLTSDKRVSFNSVGKGTIFVCDPDDEKEENGVLEQIFKL